MLLCSGVIEADVVEYQTATALINFLDFHFILQVNMPVYFPEKQPKLTFRSVYHTDSAEKPFSKSTRSYPWSPRWLPQEMIERLQSFVAEVVPNFQKISVLEGTGLKYADKSSESSEGYNKL
ncbi:BRE [Bugula neritina]|uniref:BRISC and BRCA1-A complex member 2 n=1 Tax=Bugula neritina TaxID=10212 RepID=A0A7J7K787_BUGNE|nr:BRE [Bugula neritina]